VPRSWLKQSRNISLAVDGNLVNCMTELGKRYDFNLADPINRMMIMRESGCFLARSYDFNLRKSMMAIWDATITHNFYCVSRTSWVSQTF